MEYEIFNKTEMAEKILTSNEAKAIYNMVSPIYGESYVALWIFQAIGKALDKVSGYVEEVYEQLNPETATWLLPLWEERYGIIPGEDWTLEQRREAVISRRKFNAPITPIKLSDLVSAIVGVPVDIIENTGPNQFTVYIRRNIEVDKYANALQFVDSTKAAHLIYLLEIAAENATTLKNYVACGVSQYKTHYVEVT